MAASVAFRESGEELGTLVYFTFGDNEFETEFKSFAEKVREEGVTVSALYVWPRLCLFMQIQQIA